jgi:hypothetical protein
MDDTTYALSQRAKARYAHVPEGGTGQGSKTRPDKALKIPITLNKGLACAGYIGM